MATVDHRGFDKVYNCIYENRSFTNVELCEAFPPATWSVIYDNVSVKVQYKKIYAIWVPRILTEEHEKMHMATGLSFLECYDWNSDLTILRPEKTWISHCTHEIKWQS